MAAQFAPLSPAELAYLHSSLSLTPPIRSDGRRADQFRALSAEAGILPAANGSARVCFADGTEAIVGVKAEVEKTTYVVLPGKDGDESNEAEEPIGSEEWVEMSVDIPGVREDEPSTAFLTSMLSEALRADRQFTKKLYINRRFHWKLYLDILLISPPLSYPLPLLSLTTHLALLSTRLPRLTSEGDEDPMFDDDWEAAGYLYPPEGGEGSSRPPITLLLAAVGKNIVVDPTKEELAVADTVLAVSAAEVRTKKRVEGGAAGARHLNLCSVRTIDPPSRQTAPGVPSSAVWLGDQVENGEPAGYGAEARVEGLWRAPFGGTKIAMLQRMVDAVLKRGGAADEVLDGLEAVELA